MNYQRVKGCYDILPEADEAWKSSAFWQFIRAKAEIVSGLYGFQEIILPALENTEVFTRSVGKDSDIITKEMYTFLDKANRSISLRPELTAPTLRAYIENGLHQKACQRFYYLGPCWRYDRAQKGRYRQFYQYGIELIGQHDPFADVETILLLLHFYKSLGLNNTTLLLNSIGDKSTRDEFAKALRAFFKPRLKELSEDSQRRFETNPLRIIDSKAEEDKEVCKTAPKIINYLSSEGREYFENVCSLLTEQGINYTIDHNLVRGLDYYCDTVYEIVSNDDLGAQNSLGAGGRYDGLMKQLGGPDKSGVGFATGIERIMQALISQNATIPEAKPLEYYIIPLSEEAKKVTFHYLNKLRQNGHSALLHHKNFNVKKGLQAAGTFKTEQVIIVGDDELQSKKIKIKNLSTREEREISISFFDTLEPINK